MDYKVEIGKISLSGAVSYVFSRVQDDTAFRLLMFLLLLMIFDTILGWAKAFKAGKWKSSSAKWGMLGKIFQMGFITLAYVFSWALGNYSVEYWFIAYFCLVEIGSILENAYALGMDIPKGVVDIAVKGKYFAGYFFVEKLKAVIQAITKVDFDELEKKSIRNTEADKEVDEVDTEDK